MAKKRSSKRSRKRLKRNPETDPSYQKMFEYRLEREGRLGQYKDRRKELMSEGNHYATANAIAREEFGFMGDQEECWEYYEHRKRFAITLAEEASALSAEQQRKDSSLDDFEDALASLPNNAPRHVEIEWIEAHPAMMRKARAVDGDPVLLTADDLLNAPHGPCPSRSAAGQLQHWVNDADTFYKQIIGEVKKKLGGSEGAEQGASGAEDEGVSEIESMLDGFAEEVQE